MKADLLYKIPCRLGEGPMWHARRKQIFWVDIEGMQLHHLGWHTGKHGSWDLETRPGAIVPDTDGNIIMAMEGYIARFDPDSGVSEKLLTIEEPPGNRCNDGKCDPAGRFWVGTMGITDKTRAGSLYCIFPDMTISTKIPRVSTPNGIVWTKDKKKMYWIDTSTQLIREYEYDDLTADIRFVRNAIVIPMDRGRPDGMTIDEDDRLWVAHWGGSGVYHWDPANGKLIEKIEVPVPHVTSCVFGGDSMQTLFITTARNTLSAAGRMKYPLSGSIFMAETSTRGFAPNVFGG